MWKRAKRSVEKPAVGRNDPDDPAAELALLEAMTAIADAVVHARRTGAGTYELLDYAYWRLLDYDTRHSGSAYMLWAEVVDIAEVGPASTDLCDQVALMVAEEWLAVDESAPTEVEQFFERWARTWDRAGITS